MKGLLCLGQCVERLQQVECQLSRFRRGWHGGSRRPCSFPLLESNGTVLTFFCGLAVIVTLAGIWVVNFYPIWMEDSPEPAVFTTQVEKEFGVHDFSCPPDVMSVKDGLPDAGTYRCTITDSKDDSTVRDVRLVVMADNKVGLYDADGKALK